MPLLKIIILMEKNRGIINIEQLFTEMVGLII